MAVTQAYSIDSVTIGSTEISIVSGTSTLQTKTEAGAYQVFIDGVEAAMAKGDEFIVRVYEKTVTTKRVIYDPVLSDLQSQPLVIPGLMLLNGWDVTIQKVAGTDRAFDASIRKAA